MQHALARIDRHMGEHELLGGNGAWKQGAKHGKTGNESFHNSSPLDLLLSGCQVNGISA
jgi:hypothetical protein